jgi:hypothetical protein
MSRPRRREAGAGCRPEGRGRILGDRREGLIGLANRHGRFHCRATLARALTSTRATAVLAAGSPTWKALCDDDTWQDVYFKSAAAQRELAYWLSKSRNTLGEHGEYAGLCGGGGA